MGSRVKEQRVLKTGLLGKREILLFGEVDTDTSKEVVKSLRLLGHKRKSITLWINSPGGDVTNGIAIIDSIRTIRSPVVTITIGEACSMTAFIFIVGDKRIITKNSIIMFHPISGGVNDDYISFTKDRIKGLEYIDKITNDILKKRTKLTKKEIEKARKGELWLTAEMALKKGVADSIL